MSLVHGVKSTITFLFYFQRVKCTLPFNKKPHCEIFISPILASHMQGLTTELVNAVFMATKLAGDINVYDYRVREFEKIYRQVVL